MKKTLAILIALTLVTGIAAAEDIEDDVHLEISQITGGNAFEEGQTIRIDYQSQTDVRGALEFVVNGEVIDTHYFTGSSDEFPQTETFTYRDTPELGEYEFYARYEAEDGRTTETIRQEFVVVESDRIDDEYHRGEIREEEHTNIRFAAREYNPRFGFEEERVFDIYNSGDEDQFVSIEIPDTPDCRIFEIEETNEPGKTEFGKHGIFEMLPASAGVGGEFRQTITIKINTPVQEQLGPGDHRFECEPQVDVSNGQAEDLLLVAEPTNSAAIGTLRTIQTGIETGEFEVAGQQVPAWLVALIILVLAVIGGYLFQRTF